LAKSLKLPGFRKGHIPFELAKQKISEQEIISNSLNPIVQANYQLLLNDSKLNKKEIIEDALSVDIDKVDANHLTLVYEFENYPEITLPEYNKIVINYQKPNVTDAEIESEINRLTKNETMLLPKEQGNANKGDMAIIDFEGFIDGKPFAGGKAKDYELELGSHSFIDNFEEQIEGMKIGESKEINVKFPDDYHAKEMAGKSAKFNVVLKGLKTIKKPTLDDEFVKRLKIKDVETVSDLKKYLDKNIFDYKDYTNKQKAIKVISDYIADNTKLSYVPNSLLTSEFERIDQDTRKRANDAKKEYKEYITKSLGFKNLDEYKKVVNENATRNLVLVMAIEKLTDVLQIKVEQADIDEYLAKAARVYGMKVEDLRKQLANNFEMIETILVQQKVFDKLINLNQNNKSSESSKK